MTNTTDRAQIFADRSGKASFITFYKIALYRLEAGV
jgi:hypothetical protein